MLSANMRRSSNPQWRGSPMFMSSWRLTMSMSTDSIQAWLLAFIENNYDEPSIPSLKGDRIFRTEDVRASILRYMKDSGERVFERSYSIHIGRKLTKLLPLLRKCQVLVDKKR